MSASSRNVSASADQDLATARAAAHDLHSRLVSLQCLRKLPRDKAASDFPGHLLPPLTKYWLDRRRQSARLLRPFLDRLTASREPIVWGDGWAGSASNGLIRTADGIDIVVENADARAVLDLIDAQAPNDPPWSDEYDNRAFYAGEVVRSVLDPDRDEMVELVDGRIMTTGQWRCEGMDPPLGLALYERLAASEEFRAAVSTVKFSDLWFGLNMALIFDFALAGVEIDRDFALAAAWEAQTLRDGGQADNKADRLKKKTSIVPANKEVAKLAKKIRTERTSGVSMIDSARDLCENDETKARSLLRQLRRFPDLLR